MKKTLLAALAMTLPLSAAAQPSTLPDLSADVHMIKPGGQTFAEGKIRMSKVGARMEMQMPGAPMKMINISRVDKNVAWVLLPNNSYIEQPLPFDPVTRNDLPEGWTQTCEPGETIDGHPTDKCAITGKIGSQTSSTTIWKAKDLGGVVIRNIGAGGGGLVLKNIVTGPQAADLFELPTGAKKMDVSAGMAEMMKKTK